MFLVGEKMFLIGKPACSNINQLQWARVIWTNSLVGLSAPTFRFVMEFLKNLIQHILSNKYNVSILRSFRTLATIVHRWSHELHASLLRATDVERSSGPRFHYETKARFCETSHNTTIGWVTAISTSENFCEASNFSHPGCYHRSHT